MAAVDKITSWIPCNEASGVRANAHTTGATYDLAEVNTVDATAGIKGNAANIVAANLERLINSTAGRYDPAVNFSYGVWVQNILGNGTNTFRVMGGKYGAVASDREWLLQLEWSAGNPFLTFQVFYASALVDSFPQNVSALGLPSNAAPGWTFVSVTRTNDPSDRMIIRVNDATPYVKLITHSTVYTAGTNPFEIGLRSGGTFGGLVADEIIWCESQALTDAEHLELWNAGVGVTYEEIFATVPDAPSLLTATATAGTKIALAWVDNSDDETGFKVERSLDGTTGWTLIQTTAANATTYTDTGLTPGVEYFYRVAATNAEGDSAYTDVVSATTLIGEGTVVLTETRPTVVLTETRPTCVLTETRPTVVLTEK